MREVYAGLTNKYSLFNETKDKEKQTRAWEKAVGIITSSSGQSERLRIIDCVQHQATIEARCGGASERQRLVSQIKSQF